MNTPSVKYNFLLFLLLLPFIAILSSCNDRAICDGTIVVENEIPDITLYLNGDPFRRDIYEEPPVFRHTLGKDISILVYPENESIVSANRILNDKSGELTVIEVVPKKLGTTLVTVTANDECILNETQTSFQVTVEDTTNL